MKRKALNLDPRGWELPAWRKFFAVAACWNFGAALPVFALPDFHFRLYFGVKTIDEHARILFLTFYAFVFLFGILYAMVAYNPPGNRNLVFAGILGKIYVTILYNYMFLTGTASLFAALGGNGDFIFTLFFIYYLLKGPKE
ncbi:MAG: hypothetical protein SWH61_17440 [Thermodesulfobacteriota bacterium]|nr:hypothetical protein [Thermodesulfobacteriota bacterium]